MLLAAEPRHQQNERVEILHLIGANGVRRFEELHLDAVRFHERRQVEVRINGRAVRLAKIAGQRDAERRAHFLHPARNALTASASALCSTHIAGIANEVEALPVEFDAGLHVRHQSPERLFVLVSGLHHPVDRLAKDLAVEVAGHAQRDREVEMADPQAIHARQRGQHLGVLHALRGFDLAEEGGARIGRGEFFPDLAGAVAVVRHLQRHAALAVRRVFHSIQDLPRFGSGADHRQHDPLGAHVAGAGDVVVLLRGHTNDHCHVGRFEVAHGALHRFEAEAGMLEIEKHEVTAGGFHDVADAGGGELHDEVTELGGFGARHFLQAHCLLLLSFRMPARAQRRRHRV